MVFYPFIVTSSVIMKPLGLHNLHYDVVTTFNHSGGNVHVFIVEDKVKSGVVKHGQKWRQQRATTGDGDGTNSEGWQRWQG